MPEKTVPVRNTFDWHAHPSGEDYHWHRKKDHRIFIVLHLDVEDGLLKKHWSFTPFYSVSRSMTGKKEAENRHNLDAPQKRVADQPPQGAASLRVALRPRFTRKFENQEFPTAPNNRVYA